MATYTYPGVYIQEVPKGPGPVQSASPSTCAMIGFTDEGLVNEPTLVTSFPEFSAKFGSFSAGGRLPTAAFAYFQNGGQNLVVVRTVGAGASVASSVISEAVTSEAPALSPAANGTVSAFTFGLSKTPVVAGSVSFSLGGVTYTDNGSGVILAGAVPRGTIDYVDGSVTLTTVVAPAAGSLVSATYQYENFHFAAKSAGAWGNSLMIEISGDQNSVVNGEFTAFIVTVMRIDADGQTVGVEVMNNINFDVDSPNFIATRINDARRGSDFVSVVAGSHPVTPAALRDISTTDSLSPVGLLNGVNKAFSFSLHSAPVIRGTLSGTWRLGTAQTFAALSGVVKPVYDVQGQSNLSVTVTTSTGEVENFAVTQTGAPGTAIVQPFSVVPGDAANRLVGNFTLVSAATGAWNIVITEQGTATPIITSVKIEYVRANPLKVIDDGLGEITLDPSVTHDADVSLQAGINLNTINYTTGQVYLTLASPAPLNLVGANTMLFNYTSNNTATSTTISFDGGDNGAGLLRSDVSAPSLAANELGLYALNRRDELLNVCIPDFASNELVSQDLIDYCETRKDRFAIISVPEGYSYTEAIDYKRNTLLRNSNRAAIYYPHLKISDPVSGNEINFPAVAHMAGIFARTDSVRNVSKAPAGTVDGRLSFATGLEVELTPQQAGFVNQANINNLVSWSYTGLVAWGARTLEVNGDFPYIQMRRLFMFVEKSVFNSTQGFVFESNTAGLRAAIKLQIEAFLLGLHRSGHFAGTSPAQSFFVICDSSNNPQTAIDQGQLVVDVGIAPTKPAEFVVFRFQQKTIE